MVTELQKKTAQAIVNVFETGKLLGNYACVTVLPGDSGHLTYGRSQTTLTSGNLYLLIKAYCDVSNALYAESFKSYFSKLEKKDVSLDVDSELKNLLKEAGNDPTMHAVQDQFFDRVYWNPAVRAAGSYGIYCGLGVAVAYDSKVHGSLDKIAKQTIQQYGYPREIGEHVWIEHYVNIRKNWLAAHSNTLLHKTVYRMESFQSLIQAEKWELELPLKIRSVTITEEDLFDASPAIRATAEDEEDRVLFVTKPPMKGEDVEDVQTALNALGFDLTVDGIYGEETADAVKKYQRRNGLTSDGIVGNATCAELFHSQNIGPAARPTSGD